MATELGFQFTSLLYFDMNSTLIEDIAQVEFYVFILAPFVAIPLLLRINSIFLAPIALLIKEYSQRPRPSGDTISVFFIMLLLVCYQLLVLAQSGHLSNIGYNFNGSLDYNSLIDLRQNMMIDLGNTYYYEITYMIIPTLVWFSFYKAFHSGSKYWFSMLAFSSIVEVFFLLSSIQKAPLLVFFIGLALSHVLLKGKIEWKQVAFGGFIFALFLITQAIYSGTTNAFFAISHLVFRLAHAAPFYFVLYPETLPYQELNYGFGLLGIMTTITDNQDVYNQIYLNVGNSTQGSATAAAHIRGFTHGGWLAYALSLVAVSLVITFVNQIIKNIKGPIAFSLGVQGLICMYFLTQTSLRGAILESYGYFWSIVVVASIFLLGNLVPKKRRAVSNE